MGKRNKWTPLDHRRLLIAYNMGAKYAWLCQILDRSETSINKYLNRSGIRPLGTAKGTGRQPSIITLDDIWAEIHRQEKLYPLEGAPAPLKPFKKPLYIKSPSSVSGKRQLFHDAVYCTSLQKAIHYLSSSGFSVKKINLKWADYVVNSKLLSACQLLILANRRRYETGLRPFVVSGFVDRED